jgi:hypothetical protein
MNAVEVSFSAIMRAKAVLFCTPGLRFAQRSGAGFVTAAGSAICEKTKYACEQI